MAYLAVFPVAGAEKTIWDIAADLDFKMQLNS